MWTRKDFSRALKVRQGPISSSVQARFSKVISIVNEIKWTCSLKNMLFNEKGVIEMLKIL